MKVGRCSHLNRMASVGCGLAACHCSRLFTPLLCLFVRSFSLSAGEYIIQVTASDGCRSSIARMRVMATCPNTLAFVDVTPDQDIMAELVLVNPNENTSMPVYEYITPSTNVMLQASANGTLSGPFYSWSLVDYPEGFTPPSATTTSFLDFVVSKAGVYIARVQASDGCSLIQQNVMIVLGHAVPFLNAGQEYSGFVEQPISLSDVRYINSAGVPMNTLSHASINVDLVVTWRVLSAPAPSGSGATSSYTLQNAETLQPTFTPWTSGIFFLSLHVHEGPSILHDRIMISVQCPHVLSIALPQIVTLTLGNSIELEPQMNTSLVAGADAGTSILPTIEWFVEVPDGVQKLPTNLDVQPVATEATPSNSALHGLSLTSNRYTLTPDGLGEFLVSVEVTYGCASAMADTVAVVECGSAPVADAGEDMEIWIEKSVAVPGTTQVPLDSIDLPSITLGGSGTTPGQHYGWRWVTLPEGASSLPALGTVFSITASTSFVPPVPGAYVAELTVKDRCSVARDRVTIQVGYESVQLPPCPSASNTPTPSSTPTPSLTPTRTVTPSTSPTRTVTPTRTITPSTSPTPTRSPSPSSTNTATRTPSQTPTRSPTPSVSLSASPRPPCAVASTNTDSTVSGVLILNVESSSITQQVLDALREVIAASAGVPVSDVTVSLTPPSQQRRLGGRSLQSTAMIYYVIKVNGGTNSPDTVSEDVASAIESGQLLSSIQSHPDVQASGLSVSETSQSGMQVRVVETIVAAVTMVPTPVVTTEVTVKEIPGPTVEESNTGPLVALILVSLIAVISSIVFGVLWHRARREGLRAKRNAASSLHAHTFSPVGPGSSRSLGRSKRNLRTPRSKSGPRTPKTPHSRPHAVPPGMIRSPDGQEYYRNNPMRDRPPLSPPPGFETAQSSNRAGSKRRLRTPSPGGAKRTESPGTPSPRRPGVSRSRSFKNKKSSSKLGPLRSDSSHRLRTPSPGGKRGISFD